MRIPILSGNFADDSPSLRTSYPKNLTPVVEKNGISEGYLRPADGIEEIATTAGIDRGGILWDDAVYKVVGSKLVRVNEDDSITELGDVDNNNLPVSMDYSFSRLAIVSNFRLFYWDKSALTEVTDPDLGRPTFVRFVDQYFMLATDYEFLAVTELNDPTQIDANKYGSAEIDPDQLFSCLKVRNEPHAVGRYTIEVFRNIGGSLFPFQRIQGAQITKGAYGVHASCEYLDMVAFCGSGRNEPGGVYVGANSQARKISTREIDEILEEYTEAQKSEIIVEYRQDRSSQLLYVHLPDRTMVYDGAASQGVGQHVWHTLTSGLEDFAQYRARHFVYGYGKWYAGDPQVARVGVMTDKTGSHWGELCKWEFGTQIVYNESNGVIFHELELVCLNGSAALGDDPELWTQYSKDLVNWSQIRSIKAGKIGERIKRLVWRRQGLMRSRRIQRFVGDSRAHISFIALNAEIEPLGR